MDNASLGNRFYVKLLFYRLVEPYVGIILDYILPNCINIRKPEYLNRLAIFRSTSLITFLSIKNLYVRIIPSYTTCTLNCYLVTYRYIPYTIYFHSKITYIEASRSILACSLLFCSSHAFWISLFFQSNRLLSIASEKVPPLDTILTM